MDYVEIVQNFLSS